MGIRAIVTIPIIIMLSVITRGTILILFSIPLIYDLLYAYGRDRRYSYTPLQFTRWVMRSLFGKGRLIRQAHTKQVIQTTVIHAIPEPVIPIISRRDLHEIDEMSGAQFEDYIFSLMKKSGEYSEIKSVGGPGDRGVDIKAIDNDDEVYAVQCKRQRNSITHRIIRELCGALNHDEIGMLITNSTLTKPAQEFANERGIIVIDRYDLAKWIADVIPSNEDEDEH